MKVFLSHNMRGLTGVEIHDIREKAEAKIKEKFGDDVEFIDNFNHATHIVGAPPYSESNRLWHLGASIQQLGDADAVYFCYPHDTNSGCLVEKYIAALYGIRVLNDEMEN